MAQDEPCIEGTGYSHQDDLEGPEAQWRKRVGSIIAGSLAAWLLGVTHKFTLIITVDPRPTGSQQSKAESQEHRKQEAPHEGGVLAL